MPRRRSESKLDEALDKVLKELAHDPRDDRQIIQVRRTKKVTQLIQRTHEMIHACADLIVRQSYHVVQSPNQWAICAAHAVFSILRDMETTQEEVLILIVTSLRCSYPELAEELGETLAPLITRLSESRTMAREAMQTPID